jgi:sterol desaturase/sphingolipid hydroxylase (fatty acid hydroxylase superfamily)
MGESACVPTAITFALVLSALHASTLFATDALFRWMFRRGIATRLQVDGGKPPKPEMLSRCVREVLLGQLAFGVICAAVLFPLWTARGGRLDASWASPVQIVVHLFVYSVLNETIFYWSHRTLHLPWLYKRVHARHHRFVHVRVPVAEYAHGLENAVNFVAFFAGPLLLGAPFTTLCVWIVVRIFETAEAHSGYALTRSGSRHAYHHLHAHDGCYGSFLGFWDTLLGTDRAWRAWRARTGGAPAR